MVFTEENRMSVQLSGLRLPLAHFTLEIEATLSARVTAIFGASGAGKTSLFEVIAGLRRPAEGRVLIDGAVMTDVAAGRFVGPDQRAIGYVPQEGALFPHLSVRRNLLYGWNDQHVNPGHTLEHVSEVLEIADVIDRRIQTLSGGQKQRVALGRALLASPRLLLLDEPLAGLDAPLRERLLPYLGRLRDEFALPILYVTHSPDEVMALCDEVLVLSRGKVERRGSPAELFEPAPAPRYRLRERS